MAQIYLHANADRIGQSAPTVEARTLEREGDRWAVLDILVDGVTFTLHLAGPDAIADLGATLLAEAWRLGSGKHNPLAMVAPYIGDVESVL